MPAVDEAMGGEVDDAESADLRAGGRGLVGGEINRLQHVVRARVPFDSVRFLPREWKACEAIEAGFGARSGELCPSTRVQAIRRGRGGSGARQEAAPHARIVRLEDGITQDR